MSADNWTICPRCERQENERVIQLKLQAGKSYGKVPSEEYLDMLKESEKPAKHEQTLREDYQIGTYNGGFSVEYRCSCSVCGLSHKFMHSEKLKL